ncbi:MAG: thymidine kinase [Candidatus Baltobacteraceae bacterium]
MAKLYFRYSAMNAGKSTALLQVAHNYEENGRRVRIYTAAIDRRHGPGNVTSRLGPQRKVETFDERLNFGEDLRVHRDVSCVLVDEAQFLQPAQVRELHRIAHVWNMPVICYGIRTDFLGEPFPGSAHLLALADSLEEVKNICACGKKATMNVRVDVNGKRVLHGEQVAIEGSALYIQTCGNCFYAT